MRPELVRFSSRRNAFRVKASQCADPECDCTEIKFRLAEVVRRDESSDGPLRFEVCVDPETWQEIKAPDRPAYVSELAGEFLREYPQEDRLVMRELGRKKREQAHRLREYRIDPTAMAEGMLIAFSEITRDPARPRDSSDFYCRFEHGGIEYLVEDRYCPNPDCKCREVHLAFAKCGPSEKPNGGIIAKDQFMAAMTLDGHLKIEACYDCAVSHAEDVASAWLDRFGKELGDVKWRYEKVKEIARRSLRVPVASAPGRTSLPPRPPTPAATRPGRNDPCPCGSGKKYKKCCGR